MVFGSRATEDVLRVVWQLSVIEPVQRRNLEQWTLPEASN